MSKYSEKIEHERPYFGTEVWFSFHVVYDSSIHSSKWFTVCTHIPVAFLVHGCTVFDNVVFPNPYCIRLLLVSQE